MALFISSGSMPNEGSAVSLAPSRSSITTSSHGHGHGHGLSAPGSGDPAGSVRDALSTMRPAPPVASVPPPQRVAHVSPRQVRAFAASVTSAEPLDAAPLDAAHATSILLTAPADAASDMWSGSGSLRSFRSLRSFQSFHDANAARSILNSNPANRPRSVVMHLEHAGPTVAAHNAAIEEQVGRIRASLAHTQQVADARLRAEASALGNLQPRTWDALVHLALDAMGTHAACSRQVRGHRDGDGDGDGAAHVHRLRDTMKHLSSFCQKRHSGLGPQLRLDQLDQVHQLHVGRAATAELGPQVHSLGVAWAHDVRIRTQRLDRYLADCERGFADFVVTAKGAAQRAWTNHLRLQVAVAGMEGRLDAEEAARHKELSNAQGELPDATVARLDTASAVSKVGQPLRIQQRVSDAALANQLRNRSDRLAATIHVLLRQQLQAAKEKGALLANMRLGSQVPATLAQVRALDTKAAALGEQVVRLNAERADVEDAWTLATNKTLSLEAGGCLASTTAQRVVRETVRAQAQARASALAEVDTVLRALRDKLQAEATNAERATFQHFAVTLMETRAMLAERVDAARVVQEEQSLQARTELQAVIADLERNVSVRGGSTIVAQARTAAHSAVAHHMTHRVKQHLERVDAAVKELLTFINHLEE